MDTQQHTRILILGGGFAGAYTAIGLQDIWGNDPAVQVTLVSRDNYFLMTPLLFEAGSGVLEPRHVVNPIRPLFHSVKFIEAEVHAIDIQARSVSLKPSHNEQTTLEFDHLVLALGGFTNPKIISGSEHALTFKNLGDAIYLRNHIIQMLEHAAV